MKLIKNYILKIVNRHLESVLGGKEEVDKHINELRKIKDEIPELVLERKEEIIRRYIYKTVLDYCDSSYQYMSYSDRSKIDLAVEKAKFEVMNNISKETIKERLIPDITADYIKSYIDEKFRAMQIHKQINHQIKNLSIDHLKSIAKDINDLQVGK